jgi:hypothetical protein
VKLANNTFQWAARERNADLLHPPPKRYPLSQFVRPTANELEDVHVYSTPVGRIALASRGCTMSLKLNAYLYPTSTFHKHKVSRSSTGLKFLQKVAKGFNVRVLRVLLCFLLRLKNSRTLKLSRTLELSLSRRLSLSLELSNSRTLSNPYVCLSLSLSLRLPLWSTLPFFVSHLWSTLGVFCCTVCEMQLLWCSLTSSLLSIPIPVDRWPKPRKSCTVTRCTW